MFFTGSKINIIDNSGVQVVKIIGLSGKRKPKVIRLGSYVKASIKAMEEDCLSYNAKDVVHVVIISCKRKISRKNGIYIKTDQNAGFVVHVRRQVPAAAKIFGPVMRESLHTSVSKAELLKKARGVL